MSARVLTSWVPPNDPTRYPCPAAVRFVSGEEVLTITMQAFLQASRDVLPPPGQPWIEDDLYVWAGPEDFFKHLLDAIESRLRRLALERGHLQLLPEESMGCRGGTPADMGHGCPASAGSPSGEPVSGRTRARPVPAHDITSNANPLFAVQAMKELPEGKRRDNLNDEGEIMP